MEHNEKIISCIKCIINPLTCAMRTAGAILNVNDDYQSLKMQYFAIPRFVKFF